MENNIEQFIKNSKLSAYDYDPDRVYLDHYTKERIPSEKIVYFGRGFSNSDNIIYLEQDYMYENKFSPDIGIDAITGKNISLRRSIQVIVLDDTKKGGFSLEPASYSDNYIPIIIDKKRVRGEYEYEDVITKAYAPSMDVIKALDIKESLFDGCFYVKGKFKPSKIPIRFDKFDFPLIKEDRANLIKFGRLSPTNIISEGKDYTFGIELETSEGIVPGYIRKDLNLRAENDGSIRDSLGRKYIGGEYITGVLRGDSGFRHLYKIVNELNKRCFVNNTCSVHVHLGNANFNKETIVMLWKLNQQIENELFSMMPPSRDGKKHCSRMTPIRFNFNNGKTYKENIDMYYNKIFKIISLGKDPSKHVNKKKNHPAGNRCGYDTSTPRYWWLNFVPTMFNLKGEGNSTIEFRSHSATLNFTKIKNWILITQAILHVAENNKSFVMDNDQITLKQVMELAFPIKHNYLSNYIEERKEMFGSPHSDLFEKLEYKASEIQEDTSKTLKETILA